MLENCPPSALCRTPNKPRVSRGSLFIHRKCHWRSVPESWTGAAFPRLRVRSARPRPGSRSRTRGARPGGLRGGCVFRGPGSRRAVPETGKSAVCRPRAGCRERGAEDGVGSPRLHSPRSNPFGFCFCFANPGRGPNLLARTHYAVEAGRPGLFKGLAAPAPWAFSGAARPEPGGAGAGAGLRGVRLSRGRSGERRAASGRRRVPSARAPERPPAGWEVHGDGGVHHPRFPR